MQNLKTTFFPSTIFLAYVGTVFSILDGVLTFAAVLFLDAIELNPLMAFLISISPWLFLLIKIFFSIFCFKVFTKNHYLKSVRVATIIYSTVYSLIMIWHIIMFSVLFVLRDI